MTSIKEINGSTKLAAVIGSPISHSLSPLIYNTNFEAQKQNAVYMAFETREEETSSTIESLKQLNVLGINITMPGKQQALQNCDQIDQAAQYVQAINLIVKQQGKWVGYNTDGIGFWESVKVIGKSISGSSITLLGSGSTTRIILAQAVIEGAVNITVIARNTYREMKIKSLINQLLEDYPNVKISLVDWHDGDKAKQSVNQADILVQTTHVGMWPNDNESLLEDSKWLNPKTLVCDIVYNPQETLLIQQAKERQCQTLGGIHMLVHQAAINYKLMTGLELDIENTLAQIK